MLEKREKVEVTEELLDTLLDDLLERRVNMRQQQPAVGPRITGPLPFPTPTEFRRPLKKRQLRPVCHCLNPECEEWKYQPTYRIQGKEEIDQRIRFCGFVDGVDFSLQALKDAGCYPK